MKRKGIVNPIAPGDIPPPLPDGDIPSVVFEAFNELIREEFDHKDKSARVMRYKAYERIEAKDPEVAKVVYEKKWMDVGPYYRQQGWDVICDYMAGTYFVFSKPVHRKKQK